jgi:integrase
MVRKTKRQRVLSVDELVAVWLACDHLGDEAAACIRTLILTLQRRAEVSGLRRIEIVDGLWTLPAARRKQNNNHSKGDHYVPLSKTAQVIIAARPLWNAGDHVFGRDGTAPFQGWSAAVRKLKGAAKLQIPWTIHDLRRTGRTMWSEQLGLPYELGERALGHSLGGEIETYDLSKRLHDLRDSFEKWGAFVALKVAQELGGRTAALPVAA